MQASQYKCVIESESIDNTETEEQREKTFLSPNVDGKIWVNFHVKMIGITLECYS